MTLLILLLISEPAFTSPENTNAAGKQTVRMGFFEFGGMFEGASENARKSGYCYEYMMQVAFYTGWNYEYSYGSYAEMYEKLKKGEIDILPYTNYNVQRSMEFLFSTKALIEEEYYITSDSERFISPESLNGAVISTLEGADYNNLLIDYFETTDLDVTVKYYPDLDETWEAVRKGEADVTVFTSNAFIDDGWNCICCFGKKPTYIAISNNRPDLLTQLNEAEEMIGIDNPSLMGELICKYLSSNPMRRSVSYVEQEWINRHPVLHVGGFVKDAPYLYSVDNETRTAKGLSVDVVEGIIQRLNLNMKADFKGYRTLAEMEAALDTGEIDVIIPFYPDGYIAQQHNLIVSKVVRVSNMEIVYKNDISYSEALTKIATPATKLGIFYIRDAFPDSEAVGATSIQDAVDKVLNGEAKSAVAQNVVLHNIKEKYDNLNYDILPDGCGTCFAARPENYPLIRILNRGLNYFSSDEISAVTSQYMIEPNVTTKAYLATHEEAVIMLIIIFWILVALIIALIKMNGLKKKADDANKAKTTFLFNMSHDIRTPMNAILGYTDIV